VRKISGLPLIPPMERYCAVCACGIDKDGRRMPHVRLGLNRSAVFEACAECRARLPETAECFPLHRNVPADGPCPRCGSDSLLRILQSQAYALPLPHLWARVGASRRRPLRTTMMRCEWCRSELSEAVPRGWSCWRFHPPKRPADRRPAQAGGEVMAAGCGMDVSREEER
jgi:hypothetical protein